MEFGFERLSVWRKSRELVKAVYLLVRSFPEEEKYALSDQLRRAAVSVSSNLAEGGGRLALKEKCHFCQIAYGSLMEVTCQIVLAEDLGFISSSQALHIREIIEEVERLLRGYHNYLKEAQSRQV
ncbi:MAG: four helix bundle protein [Duncaniella sp.]|nr:four helix bundle protein [Duncaniella sp.]MDE6205469.1 four helix bundle protein [Duncaniella sp.]